MKSYAWILLGALLLAGCGGGGDGEGAGGTPPTSTPPPSSGIGASGGTVTGPNGAEVVIPPGALTANTEIRVEQSSQGAPALPAGMTGVGPMFAFTPHGTQFATPVTIKIPYDASAANGATPALYKTNSQDEWELVSGATFGATEVTAQISGFSWVQVVVPPLTRNEPMRGWTFLLNPGDGGQLIMVEEDQQVGGDVDRLVDFGEVSTITAEIRRPNETIPEDFRANGYVFGNNNGVTFGVLTEAPDGRLGTPEPTGSYAFYSQSQSFRKNSADARLTYTITALSIIAEDFNVPILSGPAPLVGHLSFELIAMKPEEFYKVGGTAQVYGENDHFFFDAETNGDSYDMLWFPPNFQFHIDDTFYDAGSGQQVSCPGTRATLKLARPIVVSVDLSTVDIDEEFTVHSLLSAEAHTRKGGRSPGDCEASYVGAYLRDPADIAGTTIEFEGLVPTNRPLPLEDEPQPLPDPVECTSVTNPLAEAGVLEFEAANFVADEAPQARPVVAVTRSGGATGRVSVKFRTSDGTATAGEDYTATETMVYFADGEAGRRLVRVPIKGDLRPEVDETIQLELSQPGGCAALGPQSTATLTIRNDGEIIPIPTFRLGGNVSGLEGTGLVIEEVTTGTRVTPTSDGDFTFDYRFLQGSAYDVRIASNPVNPLQTCVVNNGTGTITDANVTDVGIVCSTQVPSGSLDASFGSQGLVTTGLPGGADALALQPDGKIVALGSKRLARYNADGTLDGSFGTGGEILVTFAGIGDETFDVAVQPDGKIVVAGVSRPAGISARDDFAVARFNADGTPDPTFGTDGKAYVEFFGGHDEATTVLVQPDGKILVVGHAADSAAANDFDFAVARLTTEGALDTTFDSDGRATINVAGELDRAYAAALQADGAIVIAGEVRADRSDPGDVGVARLAADGTIDTTFGTGGVVHIDYADLDPDDTDAGDGDQANDVAIQPDGKIVVVGHVLVGSTADFLIARLNADGSRDDSFGTAGLVTTPFGTLQDLAHAVVIQPDGAIVAAGQASATTLTDFGVVRLLPDGAFDTSFGGSGHLIVDFFGSTDVAQAMVLQPDGKIVVGGVARNGTSNGVGLTRIVP